MFSKAFISGHHTALEAAGLVALADLSIVTVRTALTGTASFLDVLFLVPGMHRQQAVSDLHESPVTGVISTGGFFPVENPAMLSYLQTIGRTGHLVTTRILLHPSRNMTLSRISRHLQSFFAAGVPATLVYILGPVLTGVAVALLGVIRDWWGLGALGLFMLSRLINVVIDKRRNLERLNVIPDDEIDGDLLILLSEDRWIRMHGSVHDIKTVTACYWFKRDKTIVEGSACSFATVFAYLAVILSFNTSAMGSLMITSLLLCSSVLLSLSNFLTSSLQMFNYIVRVEGESKFKL